MKAIKELIANSRENIRSQKEASIMAEFNVVERDGYVWLTHNGIAFMEFGCETSVREVTDKLAEVRETAVRFAKL